MPTSKSYFVYILTNKPLGILYIGITNSLLRRIDQHQSKIVSGFTKKYNLDKLVYYEVYDNPTVAITREKQLKNWHRDWKINLINDFNSAWRDLYPDLMNEGYGNQQSDTETRDAEINSA